MTTPRHLVALACNRQLSRGGDFGAVMWYGLWPASSLLLLFGLVCYRGNHVVGHCVVAHLVWYYMTWCARLVAVKSTSSAAASPTVTLATHILQYQIPLTNNFTFFSPKIQPQFSLLNPYSLKRQIVSKLHICVQDINLKIK